MKRFRSRHGRCRLRDKRERHCNASRGRAGFAPAAQVIVIRAVNACFSSAIRVTGFLVARSEAVVTFETPGYKIAEILAGEGDRVTAGQTLVRLAPISGDAGGTTLKAPAAGLVTRSTAAIAATASPVPGEPLYRIAVETRSNLRQTSRASTCRCLRPDKPRAFKSKKAASSGRVRLVPASVDQRRNLAARVFHWNARPGSGWECSRARRSMRTAAAAYRFPGRPSPTALKERACRW